MADARRVVDIILQVASRGQGLIKRHADDLMGLDRAGKQVSSGLRGASGAVEQLGKSAHSASSQTAGLAESAGQAADRVEKALHNIQGFSALKRVFSETGQAMQTARQQAADLARQLQNRTNIGQELQKGLDTARNSVTQLDAALKSQQTNLTRAGSHVRDLSAQFKQAGQEQKRLSQAHAADAQALARARANYDSLRQALAWAKEEQRKAARTVQDTKEAYGQARKSVRDYQTQINASVHALESNRQAFAQARTEAARLKGVHAEQRQSLHQMRQALAEAGVSTNNLATAQRRLQNELRSMRQVTAARDYLGLTAHRDIQAEIERTRRAYQVLAQSGKLSGKEMAQALHAAQQRIAGLRGQMNNLTRHTDRLRQSWAGLAAMMASLGLAVAGMRQFGEFESAMLKVQALTGALGKDFKDLNQTALHLGATTRYTASEAAAGMGELAMAGNNTRQIIETIPSALHMAAASGLSVAESADKITNIVSQFGLESTQSFNAARHVADVMTAGFTGAATSMQQLSEAMVYCGPVANSLGYTLEDTTAILMALANNGFKASMAGTALRGAMVRLVAPTAQSQAILDKYGVTVRNTDGTMRDFSRILDDLKKGGIDGAEAMTLFGLRAGPGMSALLKQGGQAIRDMEAKLEDVDGKAKAVSDHMESGFMGSVRRLLAGLSAVAISLGGTVAPAFSWIADQLAKLFTNLSRLPGPVNAVVAGIAAVGLAFGAWRAGLGTLFATIRALPALILEMRQAQLAATGVNVTIAQTGPIAATSMGQATLATRSLTGALTGAAGAAGAVSAAVGKTRAALGLLSNAATALFVAFPIGHFFGDLFNHFKMVRKFGALLVFALDAIRLALLRLASVMSFGLFGKSHKEHVRELKEAYQNYKGVLEDIDKDEDEWARQRRGGAPSPAEQQAAAEAKKKDGYPAEKKRNKPGALPQDVQAEIDAEADRFDAVAEARKERLAALDEELADKRRAREEADFDAEIARQQRLQDASAQREDAAVDWRNRLEAQQAAQEDSYEDRMTFLVAEGEAAEQLHQDKLAQIRQEAAEREAAHARNLENIKAEREELAAAHEEQMELLAEELKAAEESYDQRAIHEAKKRQQQAEKEFEKENSRLDRDERRAREAEERAKLVTKKKEADENRSYRSDLNKLEIKRYKELRAEEEAAHTRKLEGIRAEREEAEAAHKERMAALAEEIETARKAGDGQAIARLQAQQGKERQGWVQTRDRLSQTERGIRQEGLENRYKKQQARLAEALQTALKTGDEKAAQAIRTRQQQSEAEYQRELARLDREARQEARQGREEEREAEAEARERAEAEAQDKAEAEARDKAEAEAREQEEQEKKREAEAEKQRRKSERKSRSHGRLSGLAEGTEKWEEAGQKATEELEQGKEAFAEAEEAARQMAEAQQQALEESARAAEEAARAAKEQARAWAESQKQAAEEAASAVKDYYQRLKESSEEVADRQKSLSEELLELDTTKTEKQKWQILAKQAADYEKQARAAMEAGDLDKAKELADLARQSWSRLKGGAEGVDAKAAQRQTYAGVKSAGELGIAIARLQEAQAAKAAKQQVNVANALARNLGPAVQQMQQMAGNQQAQVQTQTPGTGQQVPVKEHVLKFTGGSLRGSEADVEALLRQLEQAGLTA